MNEVQFYVSRDTREKIYVDPDAWVEEGKVQRFEATVEDLAEAIGLINAPDGPEIRSGEAEAEGHRAKAPSISPGACSVDTSRTATRQVGWAQFHPRPAPQHFLNFFPLPQGQGS